MYQSLIQTTGSINQTWSFEVGVLSAVQAAVDSMDQQNLLAYDRHKLVDQLRQSYPQYSFWLETEMDYPMIRVCTKGQRDLAKVVGRVQVTLEGW